MSCSIKSWGFPTFSLLTLLIHAISHEIDVSSFVSVFGHR
jgi:hypothetical protein